MDCRRVSRRLSAYIEQDLPPRERDSIEEHLRTCIACRRLVSEVKLIIQAASQLPQAEPGPYFTNRLLCALNQKRAPGEVLSSWKYRLTLSGVAFAIAASVTLLVLGPPTVTLKPIPTDAMPTVEAKAGTDSISEGQGFPVSDEVLKRDMALTGDKTTDSLTAEPALPKQYVQPVGIKRTESENEVF